jgi:hypothetical protein
VSEIALFAVKALLVASMVVVVIVGAVLSNLASVGHAPRQSRRRRFRTRHLLTAREATPLQGDPSAIRLTGR